eukprot:13733296-Alexandrium_andersonii.AAC.1
MPGGDQRRTKTDKRTPGAANRLQRLAAVCSGLQRFAAVCCAASPGGLPHPWTPPESASGVRRRRFPGV